jgi:hypothetical protein
MRARAHHHEFFISTIVIVKTAMQHCTSEERSERDGHGPSAHAADAVRASDSQESHATASA